MGAVEVSLDCTGLATVAVLRHRDGHVEHLRFDGAAELPSGVYRGEDGQFLTGRAALDASIGDPVRYVALPLNLLTADAAGGDATRPAAMVAALLGRIRQQATQAAGVPVVRGVIVVPPTWGPRRRTRLRAAAHRGGLTDIEIVDAATALAHHHAGRATPGREHILVLRLAGADADATILTPNDHGFDTLASIPDADIAASDGSALADQAAALVTKALAAAELTSSTTITTTVLLAPTARIAAVAAGLRQLGITAKTHTATEADTVLGALTAVTGQTTTTSRRLRQARHAVAAAIPLPGAVALLWLLLHTVIYPRSPLAQQISPIPADHSLTLWPAWSMPSVLVYIGAIAIVLRSADQRWRHSTGDTDTDTEAERRTILARGLRVTAGAAVGTGVLAALLGATTYPTLSVGPLLLWAVGPAVLLAGIAVVLASLIRDGHTSALRWQIWLRLPNTTAVLATAGLLLIHVDLYARQNWPTLLPNLSIGQNPTGLDRLGAIAVALAVLPLLIRRTQQQVLVSPAVIAVIVLTHNYTTTGFAIGALLLAISGWWITRIRPAAAYSDPHHPASTLAADLEPTTPATV